MDDTNLLGCGMRLEQVAIVGSELKTINYFKKSISELNKKLKINNTETESVCNQISCNNDG